MTWSDPLQRVVFADGRRLIGASFRGVPFFVESSERTGGRRTVNNEYPLRDLPFVEDLGRRSAGFPIEGYVLGEDVIAQRDALRAALEDEPGPGTLVHPYWGRRNVICASFVIRERTDEGRIARFGIEFLDAPAQGVAPVDDADLPDLIVQSSDAGVTAAQAELVATYDADELPNFAIASVSEFLEDSAVVLGDALAEIELAEQELAEVNEQVQIIGTQATSLARQPGNAFSSFQAVFVSVVDSTLTQAKAFADAMLSVYDDLSPTLVDETTVTRTQEAENQAAMARGIRQLVLAEASRRAPDIEFGSHEEAVSLRNELVDRIDEQTADAGDTVYAAFVELRARLVEGVPGDQELARLVRIRQETAIPSLVLAHRLYGEVEEAEPELVARINPRHPGFISGDLTVLSNA